MRAVSKKKSLDESSKVAIDSKGTICKWFEYVQH